MKKLFIAIVFACCAIIVSGQEISKTVQWRLNPILNAVEVSGTEKEALIVAIEKFQKNELT